MTIEEAIRRASGCEHCLVLWRTDTGEVASVEPLLKRPQSRAFEVFAQVLGMSTPSPFPTTVMSLSAAAVTPELLGEVGENCRRTRRRGEILRRWAAAPAAELVRVLERRGYERPWAGDGDAAYVLRLLFHLHDAELQAEPKLLARLRGLPPEVLTDRDARLWLAKGLAVLDGDEGRLLAMYRGGVLGSCLWDYVEPFGDVRTRDPGVIEELTALVGQPGGFGPLWNVILALGRIGPAAGRRAADALGGLSYNAWPGVKALRERVIERVLTGPQEWRPCTACRRGRVLVTEPFCTWPQSCRVCMGIGFVRASDARPAPIREQGCAAAAPALRP